MENTCPLMEQLKNAPSSLDEARSLLQKAGPIQNYVITFADPDEKINFILGLTENNLQLAEVIEDEGSTALFQNITETVEALSEPDEEELERLIQAQEDLNTLYKNGFRISLGERAILGIETSDAGDTDDQRLRMLLALVTSGAEVREQIANNRTVAVLPRRYYDEGIVMAAAADESIAPGSYIQAQIKPEYTVEEVVDAMQELVPNIKFQITGRSLIIPIDDLRRHLRAYYGYD